MRVLAVLALVALTGCAGGGQAPVPQSARLSAEVLTVVLGDGTVCRADWAAAGGAGRLERCGAGFDYRVAVVEKPNLLRQFWTGLTQALGAEGAVPPMARVEISGDGRVWEFVSPPPVE
ncbi:hypothetical protein GU927_007665 [Rhodobacteraceae bacterium HSP-20]|uniref:Lipoprotein n=1 Tax=Paragemmobacter amnigenus TaxID=2852097 RepID=A0ABS6J1U8_9RHOB|nr:hypothetical protein [Rhodobacter amnigenus]MBU9697723.1 hypothetical protein [Rhodobacter amnigenus]MBV4388950.1 hypothetical protein [Rhodobacter amnigenus]